MALDATQTNGYVSKPVGCVQIIHSVKKRYACLDTYITTLVFCKKKSDLDEANRYK
jgi:hypothetical protein